MKVCLASQYGEGAWFSWLFKQAGHDSSIAIATPECRDALGGLVNLIDSLGSPADYDLDVYDVTGMGKIADKSRLETPTIGDSVLADKLEEDRIYALEFMQKCGVQVPPWEQFDNPADAIRFIKKTGKRYIFKPLGDQQDKSTTYCAKSAEDLIRYFDVLFRSNPQKEFILQEHVEGTEVSTEVYLNPTGYYALNHTLEVKKLMNECLGPNTGCSGSLVWMMERETPTFQKGLKKCLGPLAEMGYVGPIDLNTIVNPSGVWGLEFCPRFGYDADALLTRLIPMDFCEFLHAVAAGETVRELIPKHTFCASVRLSIPPYPNEGLPRKFYKAGVPIAGLTEEMLDKFFIYDVRRRSAESDDLESAGICGWIGSPLGVGETLAQAFNEVESMRQRVEIPNVQYRTDIADDVAWRYQELRNGGWIKPI